MKQHAPATARNRDPIAAILAEELPPSGLVLEIAAGTGEHAVYFARSFPALHWQPSDPDPTALASIEAWRDESGPGNLLAPVQLDAAAADWPVGRAEAVYCCNMVHISPLAASEGLVAGASRVVVPGAPLILYGPWLEEDVATAPSNLTFDADLKARNPAWGLRALEWFDELAARHGLLRTRRVAMPANNLMLVYRMPE
jgi:hypothetical protein